MKKLLIECLGTFFLIFTIVMTANPFAIAAMLMAWVYLGISLSGAHFNPAVSLAMTIRGRLNITEMLYYIGAQVLGGLLAFVSVWFFHNQVVIPAPGADFTLLQAGLMEVALSFVFAFVVLVIVTAENFRNNNLQGFVIGFSVPALALLGSPISGGLFNPAIALGAAIFGAVMGAPIAWDHLFMYVAGASLGGAVAAYAYKYFYAR